MLRNSTFFFQVLNNKLVGQTAAVVMVYGELCAMVLWIVLYVSICVERHVLSKHVAPVRHLTGLGIVASYFAIHEIFQIYSYACLGKYIF